MSISPWRDQAVEQARLLNPAFLGALVMEAARGYEAEFGGAHELPYVLAFVALPLVLHKSTRDALPRQISTSVAAWVVEHPEAQVGFPERAAALVPLAKDAILLASRNGLLGLEGTRLKATGSKRSVAAYSKGCQSPEVQACLKKAMFLGRWFALAGEATTVMALWGVRP
jgi:hypothetical protein